MRRQLAAAPDKARLETRLRLFILRYFIRRGRAPSLVEMAEGISYSPQQTRAALNRLSQTHAFVLQENGELWRAAPFSAVPTVFPVKIGRRFWYGNCIWDALGIPAMMHEDALIEASCGCCNFDMRLQVKNGRLRPTRGIVHFAVPACEWYEDVVFT